MYNMQADYVIRDVNLAALCWSVWCTSPIGVLQRCSLVDAKQKQKQNLHTETKNQCLFCLKKLPLLAFSRRVKLTKLRLFVKKNDKIG
jgi:hypothetical protein